MSYHLGGGRLPCPQTSLAAVGRKDIDLEWKAEDEGQVGRWNSDGRCQTPEAREPVRAEAALAWACAFHLHAPKPLM